MKYLILVLTFCLPIYANAAKNNQQFDFLDYELSLASDTIVPPNSSLGKYKGFTPAELVMTTGDTLTGYFLKSVELYELLFITKDKEKKRFYPNQGNLVEVILHHPPFTAHIDLIHLKNHKKKGAVRPAYAVRKMDGAIRRYDGRKPFSGEILLPLASGDLTPFSLGYLNYKENVIIDISIKTWMVYKNGKAYYFNTLEQWDIVRKEMFQGDPGFEDYLKEKRVNQNKIEFVLRAYNYYWAEKHGEKG